MSGFDAGWLALREPYDHAARAAPLLQRLAHWAAQKERLSIVDLGSGTGSNLRGTAHALAVPQRWTLVEHDPLLIEAGAPGLDGLPAGIEARYRQVDLAADLEDAVPEGTDLVTAAAFLDLVGAGWLDDLVTVVAVRRAALYVALTYDGILRWRPGDIYDATVKRLFDAHQATDKGFGPALGPRAAFDLAGRLERLLGIVHVDASDWQLGYNDQTLQAALLEGYADAARQLAPGESFEIESWVAQRRKFIDAGRSAHRVGHRDILWLPPG